MQFRLPFRWGPTVVALLVALDARVAARGEPTLNRYRFVETHMGVPVEVTLYAPDQPTANRASAAAFARIGRLNQILSDYDPESELSRLSGSSGSGRAVPVSPDLWAVLSRSQDLAKQSDGAFDVTVGPYVRLWRRARRTRQFPAEDRLAEARHAVGYQHLALDASTHTATLARPSMRLDLGGIAMGYAADEALRAMRDAGVTRALVDMSGDVLAGDPPPGEPGWRVALAPLSADDAAPRRFVPLCRAAVTTSGDAYQHVVFAGKRYSHIVDPHTGLGLTTQASVIVFARDCTTADSYATAVSVLGVERGLTLVDATPGTAALILQSEGNAQRLYPSKRLGDYLPDAANDAGPR